MLEIQGPNTVTPLLNVENLKPYQSYPPQVRPSHEAPQLELVNDEEPEEFEVEDRKAHRLVQVGPNKLPA